MRNDREVACDTSVLKCVEEEDDYENAMENTLINFIEKGLHFSFRLLPALAET